MIHDPELETLGRERLHELQVERLRAVARYAYERIGLYRERFEDAGDSIGCSMTVAVVAPGSLPRAEGGKLSRVIDDRPRAEA